MLYEPDAWVVLKLTKDNEVHYRVFAGWYGGYLGADSWKMNSGITEVLEVGDFYEFVGESGSVYRCHKQCERMTGYMMSVLEGFQSQQTDSLKIELSEVEGIRCAN